MKHSICNILFALLIQNFSLSQVTSVSWLYYEKGNTLTVVAVNGVNLRDSSSSSSRKLISIPFGQKIIAEDQFWHTTVIQDRHGGWIKAKYRDFEGYVFSGFVTNLKIPKLDTSKIICEYQTWFEDIFRANANSLVFKGERIYKSLDKDKGSSTKWEVYKDETIINHFYGYECEFLILENPEITMNDVLNLLEYYIAMLGDKCLSKSENPDEIKSEIEIIKEYGWRIQKIKCEKIGFNAERINHKIIIEMMLWAI